MSTITKIGRVMVPVADQDASIAFYTEKLGFTVAADVPFGDGDRWVEVAPPGGGANVALVPPRGEYQPGRVTGIALVSSDVKADYEDLQSQGIQVDELMGGDGTVPLLFSFKDNDGNSVMVVEAQ